LASSPKALAGTPTVCGFGTFALLRSLCALCDLYTAHYKNCVFSVFLKKRKAMNSEISFKLYQLFKPIVNEDQKAQELVTCIEQIINEKFHAEKDGLSTK
jgi:hypothetical protein